MDIRRAGWRLFSLHGSELEYAVPLFLLYFLSGSFYAIGQIHTETLFLKAYGAAGLSRFFMYNGLALIAGGIVYNLFLLKLPLQRGYAVLIGLFSLTIAAASVTRGPTPPWMPFFLYMGNYLFTFFLDMHFFNFAFQYLTIRNSKRVLPFLMAGGKLGGIAASCAVFTVLSGSMAGMGLYLWAANGALMVLPVLLLRRNAYRLGARGAARSAELLPDMSLPARIARKMRLSYSSPIFAWSVLLVFAVSVANQVSEYYFSSIFNDAFPTGERLAWFLGVYTFSADLLTLFLQLFFVSRLIGAAGVQRANYIYPLSFTLLAGFFAFFPSLAAGVLLRFYRKNLGLLFRTPVFNVIMASSPRDRMAEVKSFINGIVSPLGMVAGGWCLALITGWFTPAGGAAFALLVGAACLLFTLFQNRAYMDSLRRRLITAPPSSPEEEIPFQELLSIEPDMLIKDLAAVEAFFNDAPSLELAGRLVPHFGALSPLTKENMLRTLQTGRADFGAALLAAALGDDAPYIRGTALSIVKDRPAAERKELLESLPGNGPASERYAAVILGRKDPELEAGDMDAFALEKVAEIYDGVVRGTYSPAEFAVLSMALPPAYCLPPLTELVLKTGDLLLLKHLIPHADRLSRSAARRVMRRCAHAPADALAGFLAMAASLRETDRVALLDARKSFPYEHMMSFFRPEDKIRAVLMRRLIGRASFQRKLNYLNYLLCFDTRPGQEIEGFIDYEIDTVLYLEALKARFTGGVPERARGGDQFRFLLSAFGDIVEMHKHLMLKALALVTGVDVQEVFESSIFLKDSDLNGYILEFIEASGGSARRALVILEKEQLTRRAGQALSRYGPAEVLETFTRKTRRFCPELWPPVRFCLRRLSALIDGPPAEGSPRQETTPEEEHMHTLIQKIMFLKEHTLFSDLSVHELLNIGKIARETAVPRGRLVIREGDTGEELFIVMEGKVEVSREGRILDTLGQGSCIGELSIIDKEPRSASVRALEDCRLLSIARGDFLLTLRENPAISINIMQVITQRLRRQLAS